LQREVDSLGERNLSHVRQAVINIRESKLPDPQKIGNAGSFFKNPIVDQKQYDVISVKYPQIPFYPSENGMLKLAAGWLIEQCGWKGYREGDIGVHPKQALVLVNYGNGSGNALVELSVKIRKSIFDKFGITLEAEVNII
jgi:UDP-N-acetylmuramate dehydrogenase